jgi:hypothetical protein
MDDASNCGVRRCRSLASPCWPAMSACSLYSEIKKRPRAQNAVCCGPASFNKRAGRAHRTAVWDKPEGVPLLRDLPARRVFADTVPAFLAVPVDVACWIAIPTFDMPALGAHECAPIEVLHVGIDASASRTSLSGRELTGTTRSSRSVSRASRPCTRRASPAGTLRHRRHPKPSSGCASCLSCSTFRT